MTQTSEHDSTGRLSSAQTAAVKAELDAILKSGHFSGSGRCQDFLEFVVARALEGDTESLSERFIGASLFGRPIDYETATDSIVRVRANDVRRRLAQYYLEPHSACTVRISLTSGGYVPEFHFPSEAKAAAVEQAAERDLPRVGEAEAAATRTSWWRRMRWPVLIGVAVLIVAAVLAGMWRQRAAKPNQALNAFWEPILRQKGEILICAGGNVLAPNALLGVITAGKEVDYPYFSVTTVSAVAMLSSLIEHGGAQPKFAFAATTPLPQFHEHPVILLNAYNNHWTTLLGEPLRFHFSPEFGEVNHSILDRMRPEVAWKRDYSVPYASADDYALIARFWDPSTDNWVLILAGLGRNGTEAAAQVVTSPEYLQLLREKAGKDFSNKNIEAVLKLSVIEGKTGAPTIVAVHVW